MTEAILAENTVIALLGISKSTARRWAGQKIGPRRLSIGPRRVGYLLSEVNAFLSSLTEAHHVTNVPAARKDLEAKAAKARSEHVRAEVALVQARAAATDAELAVARLLPYTEPNRRSE